MQSCQRTVASTSCLLDGRNRRSTHMRIERVVHVPAEVGSRAATPVLKHVQICLSFVLQEVERGGECWFCGLAFPSAPEQFTIWFQRNKQTHTSSSTAPLDRTMRNHRGHMTCVIKQCFLEQKPANGFFPCIFC